MFEREKELELEEQTLAALRGRSPSDAAAAAGRPSLPPRPTP